MKRTIIGSLAVLTAFAFASQAVAAGKGKAIGKTKICRIDAVSSAPAEDELPAEDFRTTNDQPERQRLRRVLAYA
jgi:hypothetical protein